VAALFSSLYTANVIPPVPLALTDIGIYHAIDRLPSGDYVAAHEKLRLIDLFWSAGKTFNARAGESAYCFSAVFAPVRLTTGIIHRWEYYDAGTQKWQARGDIAFPLVGGRDAGYRGYTVKSDLVSGYWRCSVETEGGALIGRTTFKVVEGVPELHERKL
jgi:hypothetical protein